MNYYQGSKAVFRTPSDLDSQKPLTIVSKLSILDESRSPDYASGEHNATSLLICRLELETFFFPSNYKKNTADFSLGENDILKILWSNFLL